MAPAAFAAAPIWTAGSKAGILAIQVPIREINRVMMADGNLGNEGLGRTGQTYIVGPDNTLRSDMRFRMEQPERYYAELLAAGTPPAVVDEVRRHGTAVLHLRVAPEAARHRGAPAGTEMGTDTRGVPVLRSHGRLNVPGLEWSVMAEIEAGEAFAPVSALRNRILGIGALIGVVYLAVAALLARSVTKPILALAQGAGELGSRRFDVRLPVTSEDEIGRLARSFNRMAEDLERTTVSKEEYRALAGRLITAQEDERSRVARELHDHLTQRLAAAAIEAGNIERSSAGGPEALQAGLGRIKQQMARLSDDVHRLSRSLHPAMLDDLGLVAGIEAECRAFFERGGPPVEFETQGDPARLSRAAQLALYRIVQESLRNIEKHAGARTVRIRIACDAGEARLSIEDDGRGFDRDDPSRRAGIGLASIRERARLLGGDAIIRSSPGAGTTIEVRVPTGEDSHV
jgi:signal transduction histidine kinase